MTAGTHEPTPAAADTDRPPLWPDADDEIIGGDLTAALAYCTPAGGAVATPVAPVGLRDRGAGTVSFTTSLGFGRKLDRIARNPRVALAYHAREHGFARSERFVLVQGHASFDPHPNPDVLAPDGPPASQRPPRGGTAPRVELAPAARRLRRLPHVLAAYVGADGFPEVVPVTLGRADPSGIALHGPLPLGARRAGLLAHSYQPQLIGLRTVTHTGWLDEGVYAPHTTAGFRAPPNKTLLLLANGFAARRGQR